MTLQEIEADIIAACREAQARGVETIEVEWEYEGPPDTDAILYALGQAVRKAVLG